MIYLVLALVFFALMLAYFRIADHFNIIDHPNERSSHQDVTIRGGGIIFLFAAVAVLIMYKALYLPVTGLFIIGIISFLDDQFTLSNKLRIVFHLLAVSLLFAYLDLFTILPPWEIPMIYILVIGIINAYNFMDGINGITGVYSLVVLGGLQYVNLRQIHFTEPDLIWLPMLACTVFLFFNFRTKAKCFAGDVGSVTIAFWIIFLLLDLIFTTSNWTYILFLSLYGVDTVLTIIHRLLLKQNIFQAHRFHFFQILVNERGFPHLFVALGYAVLQFFMIWWIIDHPGSFWLNFLVTCVPLAFLYIGLKPRLMKHQKSTPLSPTGNTKA